MARVIKSYQTVNSVYSYGYPAQCAQQMIKVQNLTCSPQLCIQKLTFKLYCWAQNVILLSKFVNIVPVKKSDKVISLAIYILPLF